MGMEKPRDSLRADSRLSTKCLAACDVGLEGCPAPPQAIPLQNTNPPYNNSKTPVANGKPKGEISQ